MGEKKTGLKKQVSKAEGASIEIGEELSVFVTENAEKGFKFAPSSLCIVLDTDKGYFQERVVLSADQVEKICKIIGLDRSRRLKVLYGG